MAVEMSSKVHHQHRADQPVGIRTAFSMTTTGPISSSNRNAGSHNQNKKKLGKNLNKLVKPAAPPIPDNGRNSRYYDKNSRNGLLLLSTKKPTSVNGVSSSGMGMAGATAGAGGGGLGSGGGGSALVGVNGAGASASGGGLLSSGTAPPHHHAVTPSKPYHTFQFDPAASTHEALLSAVVGASHGDSQQPLDAWGVAAAVQQQKAATAPTQTATFPVERSVENFPPGLAPQERAVEPSWNDYGGRGADRGHAAEAASIASSISDDQEVYMSKLAKQRAEKRAQEEEARESERKHRAAQRLRELEQKMKAGAASVSNNVSAGDAPDGKASHSAWDRSRNGVTRSLWEPEKVKDDNSSAAKETDSRRVSNDASSLASGGDSLPHSYDEPVIHLSSYEDRDRGEKNNAAAPRMLFDPKSGSMVAVKVREETTSQRRKERGKKNKKDRDPQSSNAKDAGRDNVSVPESTGKNGRKGRSRKDEARSGESAGASKPSAKKANPSRSLPRTCGVLYKRDEKGSCYCADNCEGDLGYGAHSVPGGRVNNPDAYAAFVEQQQQQQVFAKNDKDVELQGSKHLDNIFYGDANEDKKADIGLQTGFSLQESVGHLDWVKADEKIELVTGVDESPTLKPTAKEFAPSEAALAAAAAAIRERSTETASPLEKSLASVEDAGDVVVEAAEDDEEDDDDDPIPGLGFDPTQDMDFVMQSPSTNEENPNKLDSVDLNALALEPLFASTSATTTSSGPRHLFAFGASGTWGDSQPLSTGASDWSTPPIPSNPVGLFGVDAFRSGSEKPSESTSFLGLPSTGSWGTPGIHSLGSLTAPNSGKTANTVAD